MEKQIDEIKQWFSTTDIQFIYKISREYKVQ